jgi:hypothetical protein
MYNNKPKRTKELPFIIHADPLLEETAYPTHTHGLCNLGWPEFLIDPLSFGGEGNASRINNSYLYFQKHMNELQAILSGQIIKIPVNVIEPKWQNAPIYSLCYREAAATFEGVKIAYLNSIEPGMRFVQIWVDGDFFALTDEYYRGGVTPSFGFLF